MNGNVNLILNHSRSSKANGINGIDQSKETRKTPLIIGVNNKLIT